MATTIVVKFIDATLFMFFTVIALAAPLLDAQTCLPASLFPASLVDLKRWYAREYGDYLISEKPAFFVGVVWIELLFQWPLAVYNLFFIARRGRAHHTSCLLYGSSVLTSMAAVLPELLSSGKASDKLLKMYFPFLGLAILAILRGLMPYDKKSSLNIGKRPEFARRKRE